MSPKPIGALILLGLSVISLFCLIPVKMSSFTVARLPFPFMMIWLGFAVSSFSFLGLFWLKWFRLPVILEKWEMLSGMSSKCYLWDPTSLCPALPSLERGFVLGLILVLPPTLEGTLFFPTLLPILLPILLPTLDMALPLT